MVAASRNHLFDIRYADGVHVVWHDRACTTCDPVATSAAIGSAAPISPVGVAGGVAYVLGDHDILAFDEAASEGCHGAPKVCDPLWSAPLGDVQSMAPRISGGRVYTVTPNTELIHVFSLPGDVS